jgi:hypothetical protein
MTIHSGFRATNARNVKSRADIFAIEKSPITGVSLRYFIETKLWSGKVGVEVVDRVSNLIVSTARCRQGKRIIRIQIPLARSRSILGCNLL